MQSLNYHHCIVKHCVIAVCHCSTKRYVSVVFLKIVNEAAHLIDLGGYSTV